LLPQHDDAARYCTWLAKEQGWEPLPVVE